MAPAEGAPYSLRMSGRSSHWLSGREIGRRAEAERFAASNRFAFLLWLCLVRGRQFTDWTALERWAEEDPDGFGEAFWDFARVIGEKGRRISFAENVLRHRGGRAAVAGLPRDGLRERAASVAARLRADGIGPDEAVGGWVPEDPEGVAAFLGASAIGAVWACTPETARRPLEKAKIARFEETHRGAVLGFVRRPLAAPLVILETEEVVRQEVFLQLFRALLFQAEARPDQPVAVGRTEWLRGIAAMASGACLVFRV